MHRFPLSKSTHTYTWIGVIYPLSAHFPFFSTFLCSIFRAADFQSHSSRSRITRKMSCYSKTPFIWLHFTKPQCIVLLLLLLGILFTLKIYLVSLSLSALMSFLLHFILSFYACYSFRDALLCICLDPLTTSSPSVATLVFSSVFKESVSRNSLSSDPSSEKRSPFWWFISDLSPVVSTNSSWHHMENKLYILMLYLHSSAGDQFDSSKKKRNILRSIEKFQFVTLRHFCLWVSQDSRLFL